MAGDSGKARSNTLSAGSGCLASALWGVDARTCGSKKEEETASCATSKPVGIQVAE